EKARGHASLCPPYKLDRFISPASPPRRSRPSTVAVTRPVRRRRLRRPECIGIADRLGDRRGLRLALVAIARRGGLDRGGGDQGGAENGKGLSHGCFSRDDVPVVEIVSSSRPDMAMPPA